MTEFRKDWYYHCIFFVSPPTEEYAAAHDIPVMDLMGCLYRKAGASRATLDYRFRYYNPESTDPFDGKDRKSFYSGEIDADKAEIGKEAIRELLDMTSLRHGGSQTYFIEVEGDGEKAMGKLMMQPFSHIEFRTAGEGDVSCP